MLRNRGANPLAFGLLALLAAPVLAQVDDEVIAGVQFNFTPPGARSLAMGGAFLAVANDATAAFTNPAGITILTQKEIMAEVRQASSETLFPLEGSAALDSLLFDDSDIVYGSTSEDVTGLAFFSYVQPVGNARFAFYRHELVNYKSKFRSNGPIITFAGAPSRISTSSVSAKGVFRGNRRRSSATRSR